MSFIFTNYEFKANSGYYLLNFVVYVYNNAKIYIL